MKQKLWSKDWFAGVMFALVFVVMAWGFLADGFQSLERYTYDLGVRSRTLPASDRIAVVAIDESSIQNLGRWPWPRALHAQMVDKLRESGAKVIGSTVFYSEAQQDPGLAYLSRIAEELEASPLTQQIPMEIEFLGEVIGDGKTPQMAELSQTFKQTALATLYTPAIQALQTQLAEARAALSDDQVLAKALASTRVVLPVTFAFGRPQGRPDQPLPDYVRKNALTNLVDRVEARNTGSFPEPTLDALVPVAELGAAASAIGALNSVIDVDGAIRVEPLVVQHFDEFYPSLSLMIAAEALNLKPADIEVRLGEGVALGGLEIGTTSNLFMYTQYYNDVDGLPPFPVYSFFDVKEGKVQAGAFKDKIVIIGPTARGVGETFATPVSPVMSPALALAHSVSGILQQDFFTRPAWAGLAELGLLLLLALYVAVLVPKLSVSLAAVLSLGLAAGLIVAEIALMSASALWLKLTVPAVFVATGYGFMLLKRFNLTERLKLSSEAESAESNKMLGLAFQGQGQLDMAFEKFRRVSPVDDKLLDLLYNLALDFERKRQFNKAESVFQYIAEHNKDFRDVQKKVSSAKKMSETVILGGGGSHPGGGTLIMDATQQMEKPMLGRYQVEKELGKGAMGIVYMGKDPKIGRQVAIKTMALSQEFEADELASVKERFFREAETAGRLSHPNIVQIFDAGEEHDLAYIAMEFIKGHDFTKHIKPNTLLPVKETLKFVADAADALDYAHSNGIVHRDIKPANMMLIEASRTLKLMDFGIARIADSSKTKTGMVLGTPSYMSPEQLSGKKVDGRSDLFSLGVTLYQLLTGSLPFQAESMATLMFKIANEPHPSLPLVRPDLPAPLAAVIDRALHKDVEQRFQRGGDFARELRQVMSTL